MESGTFRAGTSPGSPDSYSEIKTLILYCLLESGAREAGFESFNEAFSEHGLVNYFALADTLDQLCASGHLSRAGRGGKLYALTPLGKNAAAQLGGTIPFSVREKAAAALKAVLKRRKRLEEVSVEAVAAQGGYLLELSIPDDGGCIMRLQVFVPGPEDCELIKKRFLNDPVYIYKKVMALLTGDDRVLGDVSPEKESLF